MTETIPRRGIAVTRKTYEQDKDTVTTKALFPGDTVEVSVTHEVSYGNGEKCWVKLGFSSQVQPEESDQVAMTRITEYLYTKIEQLIQEAVARAQLM